MSYEFLRVSPDALSPRVLKNKIPYLVAALLILASLAAAGFFYLKYRTALSSLNDPNASARTESRQLLEAVGRIIELPTGEEPTIATVTDTSKLRDQQFFANSQSGDKVIIYTNAKKAILYRPSTGKIIEVAPVNIGSPSASLQTSPTPAGISVNVVLLNGTTTPGLTTKYESELSVKTPSVIVVDKNSAVKKDYTKTFLVDLMGNKNTEATTLAQALGIPVEKLPEGENASPSAGGSADFLIIVGADKK